jgi:hypothetical protein
MKKIILILFLILLTVLMSLPVVAEADYSIGTPEQDLITFDDLLDVPLAESVGMFGSDDERSDPREEIEIGLPRVPLGDMPSGPSTSPQTGDNTLVLITLCVTSGFGFITTAFFMIRKRKIDKI